MNLIRRRPPLPSLPSLPSLLLFLLTPTTFSLMMELGVRDPPGCVVGSKALGSVRLNVALWSGTNDPKSHEVNRASENETLYVCLSVLTPADIRAGHLAWTKEGCFPFTAGKHVHPRINIRMEADGSLEMPGSSSHPNGNSR